MNMTFYGPPRKKCIMEDVLMRSYLKIAALGLLAAAATSCSKGSNESGGSSAELHEQYTFSFNGCETGTQRVTATTASELKDKLCTRLQDNTANNNCPEYQRREYFKVKCSGMAWSPFETPKPKPQVVEEPVKPRDNLPQLNPVDYERNLKVQDRLDKVFVSGWSVDASVPQDQRADAEKIGQNAWTCGLTHASLSCEAYFFYSIYQQLLPADANGDVYYVNELRQDKTGLLFAFKVLSTDPEVKIGGVDVYRLLAPRNRETLEQFFLNKANLQPMVHLSVPENELDAIKIRLIQPESFASLYHTLQILSERELDLRDAFAKAAIKTHAEMIKNSDDEKYILRFADYIGSIFPRKSAQYLEFLEAWFKSKTESIANMAAVQILQLHKDRNDTHARVIKMIVDPQSRDRVVAIVTLSSANGLTTEEKAFLIGIAGSGDYSSRQAVMENLPAKTLDQGDFKAIQALARSGTQNQNAIALLSNIPSRDATLELIQLMISGNYSDREAAQAALLKSDVMRDPSYLPALKNNMSSSHDSVRGHVIEIVKAYNTHEAILFLVENLSDSNYSTREKAEDALDGKVISDDLNGALSKQMASDREDVRSRAVRALKRNPSEAATVMMIEFMDDADYSVRQTLIESIKDRLLKPDFVNALKKQFRSNRQMTRQGVAEILGQIKSVLAVQALKDQLAVETDYSVKRAIEEALK